VIIRQFANYGGAVVNISHRVGFVRNLSDRIIYLDAGRVTEEGEPSSIFSNPQSDSLRRFIENA